MISDPVIASEVLSRKDFDKAAEVYKAISKVQTLSACVRNVCRSFGNACQSTAMHFRKGGLSMIRCNVDDVQLGAPRPGERHD